MIRIILPLCLIFLIEINGTRRRCISGGILFSDTILRSPIIVYGESIAKKIYLDTNTEVLFNATFRVDCIFKGNDIENRIEITEAGIKAGHTACQWLDPGDLYVVFLEKWGTDRNTYRPLDFQERIANNMTYELLEKTCHLSHNLPLHSTTNNCPNVSMPQFCPHDEIDVSVMPKQNHQDNMKINVKSSYFDNGNQFYLQSNVTIPEGGSMATRTGYDSRNNACSVTINWILTIIVTIVTTMNI